MTDIPKGTTVSLRIKEAIEYVITHCMRLDLEKFNLYDYDREQLSLIIKLANKEYNKNSDKLVTKILWGDFYNWYGDYRT